MGLSQSIRGPHWQPRPKCDRPLAPLCRVTMAAPRAWPFAPWPLPLGMSLHSSAPGPPHTHLRRWALWTSYPNPHTLRTLPVRGTATDTAKPHLQEAAQCGVCGVVRDEKAHMLVAQLHRGRTVHACHGAPSRRELGRRVGLTERCPPSSACPCGGAGSRGFSTVTLPAQTPRK